MTAPVTYNQNLFNTQWLTLQNDIEKAMDRLSGLHQKLEDHLNGIVTRGKAPTRQSLESQCRDIFSRQYLKRIIDVGIEERAEGKFHLEYGVNAEKLQQVADTYLGKNILITNREEWEDIKVIRAYRSQFVIEEIFKEMKDRHTGSWWPLFHILGVRSLQGFPDGVHASFRSSCKLEGWRKTGELRMFNRPCCRTHLPPSYAGRTYSSKSFFTLPLYVTNRPKMASDPLCRQFTELANIWILATFEK